MVGRKARFSNSEVATLVLMMDFLPFPSERQFLAFIRANYLYLSLTCLVKNSLMFKSDLYVVTQMLYVDTRGKTGQGSTTIFIA